jgi:acyl-CoA reductase-like NAD-dependent aldehyde dehydrogenase
MAVATEHQTFQLYEGRRPYPLVIGGEEVSTGDSFAAIDPSTGTEWARLAQAGDAEVGAAVDAAARAFETWRTTGPALRQQLLLRCADAIEANADKWEHLLPTENGRPRREVAIADITAATAIFRYFAGIVRDAGGITIPTEDDTSHVYTVREPLGVIAAIIPWNSPLITSAQKIAPALAAGNTLVLKPSEFASPSVVEVATLLGDILPPGAVNVVTGFGPEVGAALVAHPGIAKISFTGGGVAARRIMAAAAERLTPSLMELGGKSPMVVCADADLETAVQDALLGIFLANGEVCFASSRLLVHEDVYDEFLDRFAEAAGAIRVGHALDPETQVGPLVTAAHRDRVVGHIERAKAEGVELRLGGERLELAGELAGGNFVAPTIFADPESRAAITREEVFGPVAVVERWRDEDDAIARANATEYGLGAGVWTSDLARAHRIARRLDAGVVWVNKWFDTPPGSPMGGVKASGFGRELCAETLHEYSAPKTINIGLSRERPKFWG